MQAGDELDIEKLPQGKGEEVVFDEILGEIEAGDLEKSVPVLTERGILHRGEPAALVKAVAAAPEELWGYGFREGGRGMVGLTPEHLVTVENGVVETMALAGTAPRHEIGDFHTDPKEIREHELVADYLEELLQPLGTVERSERGIMDLGPIVHFHTPIEVELERERSLSELIARLHPTPALGPLPRTPSTLRALLDWRGRLGTPGEFGAPFGAVHGGEFRAIVAIRGLWWEGGEVRLPAGCGVIEASRLVNEWRELRLKREAVRRRFGV